MEKEPTSEKIQTKLLTIMLPEELLERVKGYCNEANMTIQEFVTDAIIEKLNLVYKERREKPRL